MITKISFLWFQVFKTGVTHYFSLDKARSHFEYDPQPRDLSGVVQWFRDRAREKGSLPRVQATRSTSVHKHIWRSLVVFVLSCLPCVVLLIIIYNAI